MFLHPGSTFFGRREKEERRGEEGGGGVDGGEGAKEKGGERKEGEKEENGRQIWLLRGVLALCVFHRTKQEGDKKEPSEERGPLSRSFDGVMEMTESEAEILYEAAKTVLKFVTSPFLALLRRLLDD